MTPSGLVRARRAANASALAAFGASATSECGGETYRTVREGKAKGAVIFTIGYEGRTGEELIAGLRDAGVRYLADIRQKPVSRKPDFRAGALCALCEDARIEYGAWPELGSTEDQRDRLNDTGDLGHFHRVFRRHAERNMIAAIERLARIARTKPVALLCYERAHDECHRSVIADLIADRLDGAVTAIL